MADFERERFRTPYRSWQDEGREEGRFGPSYVERGGFAGEPGYSGYGGYTGTTAGYGATGAYTGQVGSPYATMGATYPTHGTGRTGGLETGYGYGTPYAGTTRGNYERSYETWRTSPYGVGTFSGRLDPEPTGTRSWQEERSLAGVRQGTTRYPDFGYTAPQGALTGEPYGVRGRSGLERTTQALGPYGSRFGSQRVIGNRRYGPY